jgi:hypothetical protein
VSPVQRDESDDNQNCITRCGEDGMPIGDAAVAAEARGRTRKTIKIWAAAEPATPLDTPKPTATHNASAPVATTSHL